MGRILKLEKIITYINVEEDVKQFINLMKMILFLVIYMHCYACIWWYIAMADKIWILPKFQATSDFYSMFYLDSYFDQYITALYVSVSLFGGVDQHPRTTFQTLFQSFGLIVATFINAMIFGELRVIINSMNKG
jgi:hypothetical protein